MLPRIFLFLCSIRCLSAFSYFHALNAYPATLQSVCEKDVIFEIDLSYAHSAFNPYVQIATAYIGHPEEFYTQMEKPFPIDNVSLPLFIDFIKNHPSMKVLIDIKDEAVFPYLKMIVTSLGSERCICHAFIKDWTIMPPNTAEEPHWYREDIDLKSLNELLMELKIPLIANCRGFSDDHINTHHLVDQMIDSAKTHKSIICLGLYYPRAPLPDIALLEKINDAGFYAWINGNITDSDIPTDHIRSIKMVDHY
jgi:hypothetical protein